MGNSLLITAKCSVRDTQKLMGMKVLKLTTAVNSNKLYKAFCYTDTSYIVIVKKRGLPALASLGSLIVSFHHAP